MATKTISIDLDAYERMAKARLHPKESFSQVIKRAIWPKEEHTAARFLELLAEAEPVSEETLRALELAQKSDQPPDDPWQQH